MRFFNDRAVCNNDIPNETAKSKLARLKEKLETLNKSLAKCKDHKKSLAEMSHEYSSYSDLYRIIGECQVKIENIKEEIKDTNKQLRAF